MKEAQRFPADFDGIIAGAPGLDWTGRAAQAVRVAQALREGRSGAACCGRSALLHEAALDACDALDGVKDGVIGDPARCRFDPAALQCTGAGDDVVPDDGAGRARPADLFAADESEDRARDRGSPAWQRARVDRRSAGRRRRGRPASISSAFSCSTTRPGRCSASTFETDIVRAEEADAGTINALDPNLKPFFDRGGKLIQYHGWSDPQISPANSVAVLTRACVEALGGAAGHGRYRLFMAPGMGHCGGGEGPNTSTWSRALEQWVEQGKAPDQIVASHADRRRGRSDAAAVSVSAGCRLQGDRQHRRGGELRLQAAVSPGDPSS